MVKTVLPLLSAVFDRILFILAGNNDIHMSLDEFERRPDPITGHRVIAALERLKNTGCHIFSVVFHPILFILTGNENVQETSEVV